MLRALLPTVCAATVQLASWKLSKQEISNQMAAQVVPAWLRSSTELLTTRSPLVREMAPPWSEGILPRIMPRSGVNGESAVR